jgi:hypothetical protein
MLSKFGDLLVQGYGLLLIVAAGGLLGAKVAGFLQVAIEFASNADRAPDPEFVQAWIHGGWVVGAGLFAFGAFGQKLRSPRRRTPSEYLRRRRKSSPGQDRSESKGFRVTIGSQPCGVLGSIGVGGLIGGFLGLMLGGSLLLLWFSIACSPFAPEGWFSSISVETVGSEIRLPRERAATARHPAALYAFFAPIVLGAVAGAAICGVGTVLERSAEASVRRRDSAH